MLSFWVEKGGLNTQKVTKNADFSGTTQNIPKLLGQTFFQSRDWRVNNDKWKLSAYPVLVVGAGVSEVLQTASTGMACMWHNPDVMNIVVWK